MLDIDPEMRFVVIGEGKQRAALEEQAAALGVLDVNLFFLGRKPKTEVVDWIDAATMTLALLSGPREIWKDAVQNKFFDSMAGDTPIACNNTGCRYGFPHLARFTDSGRTHHRGETRRCRMARRCTGELRQDPGERLQPRSTGRAGSGDSGGCGRRG